ncbi:MAG: S8 family serine peptidase [Candidatus Kapabacteria bacterium]|nr:S8 family serine peptidase [Candidatus Kapabacteria bacterium]
MRISTVLLALTTLISIVTVNAGLLPGQDAYVVRRDAVSLPHGINRPATSTIVHRPKLGTYVPGVIVVKTRESHGVVRQQRSIDGSMANLTLAQLDVREVSSAFSRLADADLSHKLGLDRVYHVQYNEAIDPFDACAKMMDNPDVEYAIPYYVQTLSYAPNDVRYGQQPWMASMKVDKAWDVTKGASTVIIAIVDSGTDWQHEDLASNIWTNPNEIAGNNIDDDSNGYIDDIRGWDFVGNISKADAESGIYRPDNNPRVSGAITDVTGHGTVVGGCAGAVTNNAKGVASPGFNCKIIPIKCGSDNPNFSGILRGYEAIAYAADLGAHIINCSWGGYDQSASGQDIIDYAISKGSLVIAASGNFGVNNDIFKHSPASLSGVLSVGSCTTSDAVSNFSNYGMNVSVYAPGEGIMSTYPNNQYKGLTGTSFSSPLAAGIAGLVKSVHPDWTPEMIYAQIRGTADPLSGVTIDTKPRYWGRINAERAVKVNTTFTSGERMPGLLLNGLEIGGSASGRVTTYNRTTINFKIKNVLSDASGVNVTPRLLVSNVQYFGTATISLGSILRNGEVSGSFDVKLDPNFPWYASNIEVGLTISSGTYSNFVIVPIPVDLPTTNEFSALIQIPSSNWDLVDYATDGTLFATGTLDGQRTVIFGNQSGAGGYAATPFVVNSLEGVSSSTLLIGGLSSSVPTISRSTTSGNSWSGVNVGTNMASVEGIRLYDAQNGVAFGNPIAGKFGISRTTNGGATWAVATGAPLSAGTERIIRGATFYRGDAIWFGTSSGRIISSTNRGQSWAQSSLGVSNAVIVSMAFSNNVNGVLLYRSSAAADAPYRIASSTNGGANWKTGTTNISLGLTPLRVDAGEGHHLLIGTNGEVMGTDDNGTTWQPILSLPAGSVITTQAMTLSRPTLFMSGTIVSMLEYRYSGPNGTKLPEFTTTQVGFGTMSPGQTRSRTATIRNIGTSDLNVSSYETFSEGTTPANAFSITIAPKTVILAGSSASVPLRCTGTDTGSYTGKLRVTSDGTPAVIEIPLFALVSPAVSVQEDNAAMGPIGVWPNPATNTVSLTAYTSMQATIVALDGTVVYRGAIEPGLVSLDVRSLASGTYNLILIHGFGMRTLPLVITR